MITVPINVVRELLATTKGKSADQIEVEKQFRAILNEMETRGAERLTQTEIEAMFEQAGMEVALRKIADKMKADGKLNGLPSIQALVTSH